MIEFPWEKFRNSLRKGNSEAKGRQDWPNSYQQVMEGRERWKGTSFLEWLHPGCFSAPLCQYVMCVLCPFDRWENLRSENLNAFPEIIQVVHVIIISGFGILYKMNLTEYLKDRHSSLEFQKKKTWRGLQPLQANYNKLIIRMGRGFLPFLFHQIFCLEMLHFHWEKKPSFKTLNLLAAASSLITSLYCFVCLSPPLFS